MSIIASISVCLCINESMNVFMDGLLGMRKSATGIDYAVASGMIVMMIMMMIVVVVVMIVMMIMMMVKNDDTYHHLVVV